MCKTKLFGDDMCLWLHLSKNGVKDRPMDPSAPQCCMIPASVSPAPHTTEAMPSRHVASTSIFPAVQLLQDVPNTGATYWSSRCLSTYSIDQPILILIVKPVILEFKVFQGAARGTQPNFRTGIALPPALAGEGCNMCVSLRKISSTKKRPSNIR